MCVRHGLLVVGLVRVSQLNRSSPFEASCDHKFEIGPSGNCNGFRDLDGTPTYEVTVSPSDDESYTTTFQIVPPGETPDEPSRDITNPDTGGWSLTDQEEIDSDDIRENVFDMWLLNYDSEEMINEIIELVN